MKNRGIEEECSFFLLFFFLFNGVSGEEILKYWKFRCFGLRKTALGKLFTDFAQLLLCYDFTLLTLQCSYFCWAIRDYLLLILSIFLILLTSIPLEILWRIPRAYSESAARPRN
jgi:hypothetical protein